MSAASLQDVGGPPLDQNSLIEQVRSQSLKTQQSSVVSSDAFAELAAKAPEALEAPGAQTSWVQMQTSWSVDQRQPEDPQMQAQSQLESPQESQCSGTFISISENREPSSGVLRTGRRGNFVKAREWMTARPVSRLSANKWTNFLFFVRDPFFSIVYMSWAKMMLLVALLYIGSWSMYGLIGSLGRELKDWNHCLYNGGDETLLDADSYRAVKYMYWSTVTMSTLGYGDFVPSCPVTGILTLFIIVHGYSLDAFVFGMIYSKFSTPAHRGRTLLISDKLCGRVQVESSLSVSFRILNVRSHAVMQPVLVMYLVDHRPLLLKGDLPIFHLLPFEAQPSMLFLEFPCTVTCTIRSTDSSDPTPLHDILREVSAPGRHDPETVSGRNNAIRPLRSHEAVLDALSIVAIFSASETATDSLFEVRRTWPLAHVLWGHRFVAMVNVQSTDDDINSDEPVQTTIDIKQFDCTENCEEPAP